MPVLMSKDAWQGLSVYSYDHYYHCYSLVGMLLNIPASLAWKIPQDDKGGSFSKSLMPLLLLGRLRGKFKSGL